jgi:hypothetical protein
LNGASVEQIGKLGISAELLERLLDNRPHRNKLELVSRMILTQDEYSAIKDKVSVAEAGKTEAPTPDSHPRPLLHQRSMAASFPMPSLP